MNSRLIFGRGLATLRAARGLTQATFAEKAGVSAQFFASIEQGTKAPSFETLDAFCEVLKVQPSEIFEAGQESDRRRATPSPALTRAVASLPADAEQPMLEIVHAVSRLVAPKAKKPKKARK